MDFRTLGVLERMGDAFWLLPSHYLVAQFWSTFRCGMMDGHLGQISIRHQHQLEAKDNQDGHV